MIDYKDKKVVITGHTGFKGSWLFKILEMFGAEVHGFSLNPIENYDHYNILYNNKNYVYDINDINDVSNFINSVNPDIIFHLAAQSLVIKSYINPIITFSTNIQGTINLLEVCRLMDNPPKTIIVVTSDKVYKDQNYKNKYEENDILGGYDPYSTSKVCVEHIVNCYRNSYFNINDYIKGKHNTLISTVRAGNVIGGGDYNKYRLIPDIVKSIVNKEVLIVRNINMVRPWQHVLDCLYGYLLLGKELLNSQWIYSNSFNFGPETNNKISVKDILDMCANEWTDFTYIEENTDFHETNVLQLDSDLAKTFLNWNPKYNIKDTIKKTIEWYYEYWENKNIITEKQIKEYFDL